MEACTYVDDDAGGDTPLPGPELGSRRRRVVKVGAAPHPRGTAARLTERGGAPFLLRATVRMVASVGSDVS
jgi:hypothetical protein